MLEKVLIIANPVAGRGLADHYAEELGRLLKQYHQAKYLIKSTSGEEDATQWAENACQQGYDTVIGLGGDGTIHEVIEGLMRVPMEERPYFAFIPMGTVNDLARAIGYDLNPRRAIQQFKKVTQNSLDVGQVNDAFFINVIAIGIIPEEVMNTQPEDKNRIGVLAYVRDGIQAFFSTKGYELRIQTNRGFNQTITSNLILVGLTNSVAGIEFMFNDATYDDGLLHLGAVNGHTPIDTVRAVFESGFEILDTQSMIYISAEEILIESIHDNSIPTNVDGDPGPQLPLTIKVLKGALTIIIPQK